MQCDKKQMIAYASGVNRVESTVEEFPAPQFRPPSASRSQVEVGQLFAEQTLQTSSLPNCSPLANAKPVTFVC